MNKTIASVVTDHSLFLDHGRIVHVMRIGKAQLEVDAKTFIDEAARLDALAPDQADPALKAQAQRGAENMRGMAREFARYVDEASDIILTLEAACEYSGARVAVVTHSISELTDVQASVGEMLDEEG